MKTALDYEVDENEREAPPVAESAEEPENTVKPNLYQLTGYTVLK